MSVAILVMGNFVQDTVEHTLDFQFFRVHREDLMVTFVEPTTQDALFELQRMPGVRTVEPFRAVPVRLVHQQNKRRMELLGLPAKQELFRVIDPNLGPIELPRAAWYCLVGWRTFWDAAAAIKCRSKLWKV